MRSRIPKPAASSYKKRNFADVTNSRILRWGGHPGSSGWAWGVPEGFVRRVREGGATKQKVLKPGEGVTSQGIPAASSIQKRPGNRLPTAVSRKNTALPVHSGLLTCRTLRQSLCVFKLVFVTAAETDRNDRLAGEGSGVMGTALGQEKKSGHQPYSEPSPSRGSLPSG